MWTPVLGQTLLLKREPTNNKDKNAVAVYLEDVVDMSLTTSCQDFHNFCYGMLTRPLRTENQRGAGYGREPTNNKDKNAVAVYLEDVVDMSLTTSCQDFHNFCYGMLTRPLRTENQRGARLYGPKVYIQRMNELLSSLRRAGLQTCQVTRHSRVGPALVSVTGNFSSPYIFQSFLCYYS